MLKLSRMGVVILPPVPAFYNHPQNLEDLINHTAMRVLDQFDIHLDVMNRWDGVMLTDGPGLSEKDAEEPTRKP
jgi:4-hydroxy-3-polyprenylbenzoate decarboxylase